MQFAINIPNSGEFYADPHIIMQLAHEAEESGWDAFFVWDHVGAVSPLPFADPWVLLTAIAATTASIKLGPMVTPLPRRRPWKVARETVTLDHLSNGRLIFGAGIGTDTGKEYSSYGESPDARLHAAMLDEGLAVLTQLWSGEKFSYHGNHYHVSDVLHQPTPIQQPRIPVWVAAIWPHQKPLRRAAQWDGVVLLGQHGDAAVDEVRQAKEYINLHRPAVAADQPFAYVVSGHSSGSDHQKDSEMIAAYAEAGATWWQEAFDWDHSLEQVRKHIRLGPPRL